MADSSLIPGILDIIVEEEIIPLLPWHTRPILLALKRAWWFSLHVTEGDIARLTRLKQPLKCRHAVEYYHIFIDKYAELFVPDSHPDLFIPAADTDMLRDRITLETSSRYGYVTIKIFDGQWRKVAPIMGRGRFTYKPSSKGRRNYNAGAFVGVVDGTLYYAEHAPADGPNRTIIIYALDVGSGLWQWAKVCRCDNDYRYPVHICKSPGGHILYSHCITGRERGLMNNEITEIPSWKQITNTVLDLTIVNTVPVFLHLGNRLYFCGADLNFERVSFFDLNTREWNSCTLESKFRGSLNVQKDILLVAYVGKHFYILRYDPWNERWIRAGRMLGPDGFVLKWTWSVEYDHRGEKQLWIYAFLQRKRKDHFYKFQVVESHGEGGLTRNVWDDSVLLDGEVECQLVNSTQLAQPFHRVTGKGSTALVFRSVHGFHRSDTTNFEDIPRAHVLNST